MQRARGARSPVAVAAALAAAVAVSVAGYHLLRPVVSGARVRVADEAVLLDDEVAPPGMLQHLAFLPILVRDVRVNVISPVLQVVVLVAAGLSALVAADRLLHVLVVLAVRAGLLHSNEVSLAFAALPDDPVKGAAAFPTVLVQLPMFNEADVCQSVIDAACRLAWPRDRLLVQVLDDSTCPLSRQRVRSAVATWRSHGVNVVELHRPSRDGFKAGALAAGLAQAPGYELCALFDADFRPEQDFLLKTVPFLIHNPAVAFVQARWAFYNAGDSVLTAVQEIALNYHTRCEQLARAATGQFFNFNGTAGVWRRAAIDDAGGWLQRTTVEDMDLSLRAFLRGWRFAFLDGVTCECELPPLFDAYRKQQYRWTCGPMQLWRHAGPLIWASSVSLWQKLYLQCLFFGARMAATHLVGFVFYLCLVPLAVYTPEVHIPLWALVYLPTLVAASTALFTPSAWQHILYFILFDNAMTLNRLSALFAGILDLDRAHTWDVTRKLGAKQAGPKQGDAVPKQAGRKQGDSVQGDAILGGAILGDSVQGNAILGDCGPALALAGATPERLPRWASAPPLWPAAPPLPTSTAPSLAPQLAGRSELAGRPVPGQRPLPLYRPELVMAGVFLASALYGAVVHSRWEYCLFLLLQGAAFLAFGLNLVDARAWAALAAGRP